MVAFRYLIVFLAGVAGHDAFADGAIRDNSLLVEEAYNQETGVVQHITTFQRDLRSSRWGSTFTQEWPVLGQANQASFTVPLEGSGDDVDVGDVALHWRYQLVGGAEDGIAFAPRMTALVPNGNRAPGLQMNLPASARVSRTLVVHANAGMTFTPADAMADAGWVASYGASAIWLAHPKLNALLEVAGSRDLASGPADTLFVSPGVRGAIDIGGLQIVPAFAVPIATSGDVSAFLYLSFEHPFSE